jgi:hypothetical protein
LQGGLVLLGRVLPGVLLDCAPVAEQISLGEGRVQTDEHVEIEKALAQVDPHLTPLQVPRQLQHFAFRVRLNGLKVGGQLGVTLQFVRVIGEESLLDCSPELLISNDKEPGGTQQEFFDQL